MIPDMDAARELHLYIDNEHVVWRLKMCIYRALAKKKDKGQYDKRLAPKVFLPLLTTAAKRYVKEYGSPGDRWNVIFSPISRRHAALAIVEDFENWYSVDYQTLKNKSPGE